MKFILKLIKRPNFSQFQWDQIPGLARSYEKTISIQIRWVIRNIKPVIWDAPSSMMMDIGNKLIGTIEVTSRKGINNSKNMYNFKIIHPFRYSKPGQRFELPLSNMVPRVFEETESTVRDS